MTPRARRLSGAGQWRRAGVLAALVLAALPLAASEGKAGAYPDRRDLSQYIGSEACTSCHADYFRDLEKTAHWKTMADPKTGGGKPADLGAFWNSHLGCESCHGPGGAHAESGGDPKKIFAYRGVTGAEVSANCLSCHQYGAQHSNFLRSAHKTAGVACLDCHAPHFPGERRFLLRTAQPEVCYGCHFNTRADFSRPSHHRVEEGLLQCTDCHDQHGGFAGRQTRAVAGQDQSCARCHGEKAGPFVFEHPSVRAEGCGACHLPHGSPNPRLLKRSNLNLMCLECHTFTQGLSAPGVPAFHDQAAQYQACTLCHAAIHGSNFDRLFLK